MLTSKKKVTIEGNSIIDGVSAEGYRAEINSDNPEDMTISKWQQDKATYKANRIQCRKDAEEFEEMAYALQDEMIAKRTAGVEQK